MNWLDFLNIRKGGLPLATRTILASGLIALPIAFLSTFADFPYERNIKVAVALFAAIIIGYIFKENRTAIDKIRNYDYSKFNIKKKQRYSTESNRIFAAGNDADSYNILYYGAFLLAPLVQPKQSDIGWLDLYIKCTLGAIPFIATIFYFVFFNERKKVAETWIMKLDQQKRIEEHREKMVEGLRKAIQGTEPELNDRSAIELTAYLEKLAASKEKPRDVTGKESHPRQ
ncbi:hypothetical protein GFL09_15965 [Pseudomonas stutzeri]|uniref:hypothetical protein n=1 Tax=Stutzerimonas stutzeri TaxID=316 RepID=UPI00190AFF8B|nr:hypothetical protein [Stutzerimonas stutzeri]MBK3869161.1 hypothetical protein [Stutzerimonas stutzeri]